MDESAFPFALDQPDTAQMRQVKGKRGAREPQFFANGADVHALRPGNDQQAENGKAGFVPQGSEEFGGV